MAPRKRLGPIAFTPIFVMVLAVAVYVTIAMSVLIIHESVPRAPSNPVEFRGLNITEAWHDLQEISKEYHPYNSRRNDEVRDWLLKRIKAILDENQIAPLSATIINDLQSNITYAFPGRFESAGEGTLPGDSVYFEGANILVYIRGTEDEEGEWWNLQGSLNSLKVHGKGGVLVNAHFDSVSTGFGASDDGIGVVTILQLIRFFTTPGHQPKKGVVALLNNGEEDELNGARAYTQHPISQFPFTFLNLEGTGGGGRALLLRTTDMEVTRAYAKSSHPFGTVVAADGFKQGLVRSNTDYAIFQEILGLRGMDVAYWKPRARYHTNQDDTRHTNIDSLWHMLSAAISTMQYLTDDTSSTFLGSRGDGAKGKVTNGNGSEGVWFDVFGRAFALFRLRTLFAWSLTLLIASPIILCLVVFLLIRKGKFYYFASKAPKQEDNLQAVSLHGWRGASRFPIALILASGFTVGASALLAKVNPLIIYSSTYVVWTTILTLNFIIFWLIMRGASLVRPSALHRGYAYIWMFILGWILLAAVTMSGGRFGIASGYLFIFYEAAVFLATLIGLVELFALPTKAEYARFALQKQDAKDNIELSPKSAALIVPAANEGEDEPTEDTILLGGRNSNSKRTRFAKYARRSVGSVDDGTIDDFDSQNKPFENEPGWSGKLPTWTWFLQFVVVAPVMLVTVGQVALIVVDGVAQTGPDGALLHPPYLLVAAFSTMLLLPLGPIYHRFTYHIPLVLFILFIATLIYNLVAFPFSVNDRCKAHFQQIVDLDTGQNRVILSGLEEFIRPIIASLPSAAGQSSTCVPRPNVRSGLRYCSFAGLAPNIMNNIPDGVSPEKRYADWLTFNVSRTPGQNSARFEISAVNTRAYALRFDRPIKDFYVHGSTQESHFDAVSETGCAEITLWVRNWDQARTVDVEWAVSDGKSPGEEGMEGVVVGMWSDANVQGVIPALDELQQYAPDWVAITKRGSALVEGSKRFMI